MSAVLQPKKKVEDVFTEPPLPAWSSREPSSEESELLALFEENENVDLTPVTQPPQQTDDAAVAKDPSKLLSLFEDEDEDNILATMSEDDLVQDFRKSTEQMLAYGANRFNPSLVDKAVRIEQRQSNQGLTPEKVVATAETAIPALADTVLNMAIAVPELGLRAGNLAFRSLPHNAGMSGSFEIPAETPQSRVDELTKNAADYELGAKEFAGVASGFEHNLKTLGHTLSKAGAAVTGRKLDDNEMRERLLRGATLIADGEKLLSGDFNKFKVAGNELIEYSDTKELEKTAGRDWNREFVERGQMMADLTNIIPFGAAGRVAGKASQGLKQSGAAVKAMSKIGNVSTAVGTTIGNTGKKIGDVVTSPGAVKNTSRIIGALYGFSNPGIAGGHPLLGAAIGYAAGNYGSYAARRVMGGAKTASAKVIPIVKQQGSNAVKLLSKSGNLIGPEVLGGTTGLAFSLPFLLGADGTDEAGQIIGGAVGAGALAGSIEGRAPYLMDAMTSIANNPSFKRHIDDADLQNYGSKNHFNQITSDISQSHDSAMSKVSKTDKSKLNMYRRLTQDYAEIYAGDDSLMRSAEAFYKNGNVQTKAIGTAGFVVRDPVLNKDIVFLKSKDGKIPALDHEQGHVFDYQMEQVSPGIRQQILDQPNIQAEVSRIQKANQLLYPNDPALHTIETAQREYMAETWGVLLKGKNSAVGADITSKFAEMLGVAAEKYNISTFRPSKNAVSDAYSIKPSFYNRALLNKFLKSEVDKVNARPKPASQSTIAPVNTTPVNTTPVNTTPVNTTPVNTTPVNTTPVNIPQPYKTPTAEDLANVEVNAKYTPYSSIASLPTKYAEAPAVDNVIYGLKVAASALAKKKGPLAKNSAILFDEMAAQITLDGVLDKETVGFLQQSIDEAQSLYSRKTKQVIDADDFYSQTAASNKNVPVELAIKALAQTVDHVEMLMAEVDRGIEMSKRSRSEKLTPLSEIPAEEKLGPPIPLDFDTKLGPPIPLDFDTKLGPPIPPGFKSSSVSPAPQDGLRNIRVNELSTQADNLRGLDSSTKFAPLKSISAGGLKQASSRAVSELGQEFIEEKPYLRGQVFSDKDKPILTEIANASEDGRTVLRIANMLPDFVNETALIEYGSAEAAVDNLPTGKERRQAQTLASHGLLRRETVSKNIIPTGVEVRTVELPVADVSLNNVAKIFSRLRPDVKTKLGTPEQANAAISAVLQGLERGQTVNVDASIVAAIIKATDKVEGKRGYVTGYSLDKVAQNAQNLSEALSKIKPVIRKLDETTQAKVNTLMTLLADGSWAGYLQQRAANQSFGARSDGGVLVEPKKQRRGDRTYVLDEPKAGQKAISPDAVQIPDDIIQVLNLLEGGPSKTYTPEAKLNKVDARGTSRNPLYDILKTLPLEIKRGSGESISGLENMLESASESLRIDRISNMAKPGETMPIRASSGLQRAIGYMPDVDDFGDITDPVLLEILRQSQRNVPAVSEPQVDRSGNINPPSSPETAVYIGDQETGGEPIPLYNVLRSIPAKGLEEGSTVSQNTLRRAGFEFPDRMSFMPETKETTFITERTFGNNPGRQSKAEDFIEVFRGSTNPNETTQNIFSEFNQIFTSPEANIAKAYGPYVKKFTIPKSQVFNITNDEVQKILQSTRFGVDQGNGYLQIPDFLPESLRKRFIESSIFAIRDEIADGPQIRIFDFKFLDRKGRLSFMPDVQTAIKRHDKISEALSQGQRSIDGRQSFIDYTRDNSQILGELEQEIEMLETLKDVDENFSSEKEETLSNLIDAQKALLAPPAGVRFIIEHKPNYYKDMKVEGDHSLGFGRTLEEAAKDSIWQSSGGDKKKSEKFLRLLTHENRKGIKQRYFKLMEWKNGQYVETDFDFDLLQKRKA